MTDLKRASATANGLARYFPIFDWGRSYDVGTATNDLVAALVVTIMLIPQSLAYAMLAGLPPEVGLYASILPLAAYAVFGTSRTLAVGPVAVVSLMTAAAIGKIAAAGSADYATAAIALAFLSGLFLVGMGLLRLGFIANFLSHPVIAGFITASGILIAASQLKHILGVPASGDNLIEILKSLGHNVSATNLWTLLIGIASITFLFWVRRGLKPLLIGFGLAPRLADIIAKAGPIMAVAATTAFAFALSLEARGVGIVGAVPPGLPPFTLPAIDFALLEELLLPAILISVIGFVESVSVASTLAAKRRQRITPDQELVGLGAANIASAVSAGYPVTGGFARSVVNFDAGAETPAAGAFTAIGIALATLFLTPLLFFLPRATLAATIIVAVLSLVDFSVLKRTWIYAKADFAAVAATILLTLTMGVEVGVTTGVAVSIALYLFRTSRPHIAVVGRVPGSEHFRNVLRHHVETDPTILTLRVDESLYFANARYLEDRLYDVVAAQPELCHVVLMCPAINAIDASALHSLEEINHRLKDLGVAFHLSEVKGPVMDRLQRSDFLEHLTGQVFLSQHEAMTHLAKQQKAAGSIAA